MKKIATITLLILGCAGIIPAQTVGGGLGTNKVLISGHGRIDYAGNKDASGFGDLKFSALFLGKISENLFLESEIEVETGDGEAGFGIEEANLVYRLNPYMLLHAGRFLPKFGGYRGRHGEDFINRFANDPVGFGDGGIGAMVETGIGAQGGIPLGTAKMNYDLWLSNGPQLLTDGTDAGQFDYESFLDNNKNKAIGGRVGILPLANSSLEAGFSFENASKTGASGSRDENVGVKMLALDVNFFHNISALKSTVRILGEWKDQKVDKASYATPEDSTTYTFDNHATALYGAILLRPSLAGNAFIRNLEIGYRYARYNTPVVALWGGGDFTQQTFALDYWLRWNCVLKMTYAKVKDTPGSFIGQLILGF